MVTEKERKEYYENKEYNENAAARFIDTIKIFADNPDNIENFECYLSNHFVQWFEHFVIGQSENTRDMIDNLISEFEYFSKMSNI